MLGATRTATNDPGADHGRRPQHPDLGRPPAGLLIITAAWTGCRWGELAGLQRKHVDLDRGVIVIDPEFGSLHESTHHLWLGPPKTPASARTISLPPFLIDLLRKHLATTTTTFVFTSPRGCPLRRSTFDRRVFRPAVDGDARKGIYPVRRGPAFHGLRHSHKTWLIANHIPEIAQAHRLGHHLANRLTEIYSHSELVAALAEGRGRSRAIRSPPAFSARSQDRANLMPPRLSPVSILPRYPLL